MGIKNSGNSNYRRGRAFEYRVKKYLEEKGFSVIRSAGSHGKYDLVAFHNGVVIALQLKSGSSANKYECYIEPEPVTLFRGLLTTEEWKERLEIVLKKLKPTSK